MPSAALLFWQTDRMPRLAQVEAQCAAIQALVPPNPPLLDENLRGYVMLLCAHFQGFCRDLYSDCAQLCVVGAPAGMRAAVQCQFLAELKLNSGNPTVENIRTDFERFDFVLNLSAADPANAL